MPGHATQPDLSIRPLTFLQTFRSSGVIAASLLDQEAITRREAESALSLRSILRAVGTPLYLHYLTSGYGAFAGEQIAGWMYLRGWYQVLYIVALAVQTEWQGQGVEMALLRFAEAQARELRRAWVGLTVPTASETIIRLCEAEGFERGHWRIMRYEEGQSFTVPSVEGVQLRPLNGLSARHTCRQFARQDIAADYGAERAIPVRFLAHDPYQGAGRHWLVIYRGQSIAYLHQHGSPAWPMFYLTGRPEWWGSPPILAAVAMVLNRSGRLPSHIDLRLGSSAHHDAARPMLEQFGFVEHPAAVMHMIKHLSGSGSAGEN